MHYLLLLWLLVGVVLCEYRHYFVDNADICNMDKLVKTKTLDIGSGAAIFQLKSPSQSLQPEFRDQSTRCEIHIKAPNKEYGLMAYVEEMNFRQSSRDDTCVDSIQFGQDDIVPFVTIKKSETYCGAINGKVRIDRGISYDDPTGNLIVWLVLGPRRSRSAWPSISVVNMTLVVTAFRKDCDENVLRQTKNLRRCAERDRCIWKDYFCDRHFNCVKDRLPIDEYDCKYESDNSADLSTPSSTDENSGSSGNLEEGTVHLVLVIACFVVGAILFCILIGRMRDKNKWCFSRPEQCHPSQGPRSLQELNQQRHLRDTESNIYQPCNTRAQQEGHLTVRMEGTPLAAGGIEEPPPPYDALFPDQSGQAQTQL